MIQHPLATKLLRGELELGERALEGEVAVR